MNNLDKRNIDIKNLHFEKGWTLQEVGDKYGITRERVRQIIGNSNGGRKSASEKVVIPENSFLTIEEIKRLVSKSFPKILKGVLQKKIASHHHSVSGTSKLKKGIDGENEVHKILLENGIKNTLMPFGHSFDILTERNLKIEVKTAYKTFTPNKKSSIRYYHFKVSKNIKSGKCDFFVFYLAKLKKIWIVPENIVPNSQSVYIRADLAEGASIINWKSFENRFDLLS